MTTAATRRMPARVIRTAASLHATVRAASRRYSEPAARLWPRVLLRYSVDKFSPAELRAFAPFVPSVLQTLPVAISKQRSLRKLERINPAHLQWKTEDKERFYEICAAESIPHPPLCAVLGGGREKWLSELPRHFVAKDRDGAYASGFAVFERVGDDRVRIDRGPPECMESAMRRIAASPSTRLLQRRLFDHRGLRAISVHHALQTLRITTYRERDGTCRLLFWMLKLVVGSNLSDNFSGGRSGNVIAFGEPDSGRLLGARALHESGVGLVTIERHPETGRPLREHAVPLWGLAVGTALRAHRRFAEFGALGWDVAITDDGPMILEANAWWDPPTYAPRIMCESDWRTLFG